MTKITKEFLINQALEKYSENQINNAYHCNINVQLIDGSDFGDSISLNLPLTNKGRKSKIDKIKTGIRSLLLNRQDIEDRRFFGDTSNSNIKSIEIKLSYQIDNLGVNIKKNGKDSYTNISFVDGNICTLIGENGSGKSTILESVLENGLNLNNGLFISYSSGLNESFSQILKPYIEKNRKLTVQGIDDNENEKTLNGFYFNKSWVGILIFLAYSLKNNGKVKSFFREKNNEYLVSSEDPFIQFDIKIEKTYIDALNSGTGEHKSLETTDFHNMLDKLLNNLSLGTLWTDKNGIKSWGISEKRTYDFDKPKKLTSMILKSDDVKDIFGNNGRKILYYLGLLTNKSYFLDINDVTLYFNNGINLNDLSDGEFQLLVIYSLLDLFDSKETIFLFDEVDSHLHYKNINKLWEILSSIEGKIITTTHIPDSIINNEIKQIKVVKDGIIDNDNSANSIIKRLANISDHQVYSKKVASNIENIVLIDDCTDWEIFKMLAKQKLGLKQDRNQILSNIIPIKCHSGYNNSDENKQFGKEKIQWLKDFDSIILKEDDNQPREGRTKNNIKTKNIIILCDKDDYEIYNILKKDTTKNKDKIQIREYIKNPPITLKGITIYYLSFLRREIENYFISPTLLKTIDNSLLLEVNNKLGSDDSLIDLNSNDNNGVRNKDFKEIISKNITSIDGKWKDYTIIENEIVSKIPPSEISEDIENLYKFLIDKIK